MWVGVSDESEESCDCSFPCGRLGRRGCQGECHWALATLRRQDQKHLLEAGLLVAAGFLEDILSVRQRESGI